MTRGEKVIAFIEELIPVPEGAKVGEPIRLADFQKKFILDIYDNPHGTRRAILSIGRKNGKTALIACLLLAHLVGPEARQNSQLCSGALSREQAAIVFKLAVKMRNLSPVLSKIVHVIPSSKTLLGLPMNTEFRALAAEGKTAHGLSPILAILDEMGQVKGPQDDFVDAITTSQGAHEDPLLVIISTQAPTDADLMSVWIDDAITSDDPHTVCHVYTAPDDCELSDRSAWQAANPALGLFRSEKDVAEQAAQAERMPSSENTFRVLTLNQRRNLNDPFVSSNVWRENGAEPERFSGRVYGGLDLSTTTDLTSLVLVGEDDEGFVDVQAHFWMAQDTIREASKRDRAPYEAWAKAGLIRTTPGTVIDYGFVARDIGTITAGLNVAGIAFDRWRMDRLQAKLDEAGLTLPLEPWGQGYVSMAPALDAFEELLLQNLLRHGGNPPLNMCALNATVTKDPAGNRKLDKSRSRGRIDGMQALAMAIGLKSKQLEPAPQPTPWADENFSLADL